MLKLGIAKHRVFLNQPAVAVVTVAVEELTHTHTAICTIAAVRERQAALRESEPRRPGRQPLLAQKPPAGLWNLPPGPRENWVSK